MTIARAWTFCLDTIDLRGRDGRMSFFKNVIVVILVFSIAMGDLTDFRATMLAACAAGRTVLLALIQRSGFAVSSAASTLQETVRKRIEIVQSRRDPETGEPLERQK